MAISAKDLIVILEDYEKTDKSVIFNNIDLIFNSYYEYKHKKGSRRTKILGGITQSSDNTVMAWNNSARPLKIPFVKFLQIADALDIPYEYMLSKDSTWFNDDVRERVKKKIAELEEKY